MDGIISGSGGRFMNAKTAYLGLFLLAVVWLISDLIYDGLKKKHSVKRIKVLLCVVIVVGVVVVADTIYNAVAAPIGGYRYDEAYENLFVEERKMASDLHDAVELAIQEPDDSRLSDVAEAAEDIQELCTESVSFVSKLPNIEMLGTETFYYETFFPCIGEAARDGDLEKLKGAEAELGNILNLYEEVYTDTKKTADKVDEIQQFYTKLSEYREELEDIIKN